MTAPVYIGSPNPLGNFGGCPGCGDCDGVPGSIELVCLLGNWVLDSSGREDSRRVRVNYCPQCGTRLLSLEVMRAAVLAVEVFAHAIGATL